MKTLTVAKWVEMTGATQEPEAADGTLLDGGDTITVSPNGEEYCVGTHDGSQTWLRFDGAAVLGDVTGGW